VINSIPTQIRGVALSVSAGTGVRDHSPASLEQQFVRRLGANDAAYSWAVGVSADPSLPVAVTALRVVGTTRERLESAVRATFLEMARPDELSSIVVAGKRVSQSRAVPFDHYVYYARDTVFLVDAPSRALAEAVIERLP
jgi:hypothetical protein